MDTLSDMEDDEDGEDDEDQDAEDVDGLSARYKQALADSGGSETTANDDHSFARYLKASQMNM
jgi:hypothetical protein